MEMKMILTSNIQPQGSVFISSMYLFLVFWLQFQRMNSFAPVSSSPSEEIQQLTSSTYDDMESNITVTFVKQEFIFVMIMKYDFFVPQVDVVCQCSCSDGGRDSCKLDRECASLSNSTTTCTNHMTVDSDSSICSKFYKLCCRVYFTKVKTMNNFTAFYLKYYETFLTFEVTSKEHDGKRIKYNVTINENVTNLLLTPDKVLQLHEFVPVHNIPDGWYFIEDGSNELLYSDSINEIDELKMNKIGWFRYNDSEKQLSRVSGKDLEKHLHVKLLDCQSNPPIYEWKLNATHYASRGLLHLQKDVEKVSEMYKDISNISTYLKGNSIKFEAVNYPDVNISIANVTTYPFVFTCSITVRMLSLTFIKGNGTFAVEITSPHWSNKLSFSTSSAENKMKLPSLYYDSCWVCVYQHNQQLCQIPSWVKELLYPPPTPLMWCLMILIIILPVIKAFVIRDKLGFVWSLKGCSENLYHLLFTWC